MPKRKAYDDLPFLPSIIAETVCGKKYTGYEVKNISPDQVIKTENARFAMTREDIDEFCNLVDARCRAAYEAKAKWIDKCIKANNGLDQMYVFLTHWLASYLDNPQRFKERVETPS